MEQQIFDILRKTAEGFRSLLDTQYHIIIGRKGRSVELTIEFKPIDFHHLMGLGKLKDLRIATQNRENVFAGILNGTITYSSICKSRYIKQIENRFVPLAYIEQIFDDNKLIFRYNKKKNQFSLIEADYLLSTPFPEMIFIFSLRKKKLLDCFSAVPFFQKRRKITQSGSRSSLCSLKKKSRSAPAKRLSSTTASLQKSNPQVLLQINILKAQQQNDCTGRFAVSFFDCFLAPVFTNFYFLSPIFCYPFLKIYNLLI